VRQRPVSAAVKLAADLFRDAYNTPFGAKMIKAIIFDVGGVLKSETDTAIRRDVQETLGIAPGAFDEPWSDLTDQLGRGVIDEETFWEQLQQRTEARNPLPRESLLMREYMKGYRASDKVLALAHRLQTAGFQIAILSNTVAPHADFNREHGLFSGFDAIILSYEVGLRKPSPEIFRHVLKTLNVGPMEAVFIDDLEKNVRGAKAVGLHAILFKNAAQLEAELQQLTAPGSPTLADQ
jgi:epoxide hydrolase-like predicted phosphatase